MSGDGHAACAGALGVAFRPLWTVEDRYLVPRVILSVTLSENGDRNA